jgi:hypothetical protein
MNNTILKLGAFVALFTLVLSFLSCNDELEKEIIFDYQITTSEAQINGDTIVLKKSFPLKFSLNGNYDFLTFYSGEIGHEYDKRNIQTIAKDDISTSVLSFGAMPQYGVIAGTLRVFISESFQGLKLYDTKLDSTAVATNNWVEITERCNLPTTSAQVLQTSISLIDYCDKDISLAFLYKTDQNTSTQPTWEIRDLKISNTLKNGSENVIKAVDLGFSALDMLHLNAQTSTNGVWNLTNIALTTNPVMRIQSSPTGAEVNEDWLISTPTMINKRLPEKGLAIGEIATSSKTFSFQYKNQGTYRVTFVAKRANLEMNQEITKSLIVKVIN